MDSVKKLGFSLSFIINYFYIMTPLAKWFNRPRKNSSPTRLALSEFMNISSGHQQNFTFPPSNRYESTQTRTPMLITSSFYNREYPFDTYDSSADEAVSRPITPDLQPPQYQTIYNQQTSYVQEPTQLVDIPQAQYVNTPQHNSMPSLTQYNLPPPTHYINILPLTQYIDIPPPTQYIPQPSTSHEDDTFYSREQLSRLSHYRSTQERVSTPYINERYTNEEGKKKNTNNDFIFNFFFRQSAD